MRLLSHHDAPPGLAPPSVHLPRGGHLTVLLLAILNSRVTIQSPAPAGISVLCTLVLLSRAVRGNFVV